MPCMSKRPHIIVFVSDDTGRCIAPYGYTTIGVRPAPAQR